MSQIQPSPLWWETVLPEVSEQDRADAGAALLANGTKLKFLDASGALIRTVTSDAWTRAAQNGNAYPIVPGAWTDPGTGSGTPETIVITTASDVEILRLPAAAFSLAVPIAGATVAPGAARLRYPASGPPPASGKRWHPGHYFVVSNDYTHDVTMVESRRNKVRTNPYFAGYQLQVFWDKLETAQGVYNFGPVLAELDKAQSDGKTAWLRIMERSFHGASRGLPCPAYIHDGGGTYAHTGNGQNMLAPKFWVPWVGSALFAMVAALMEAVDGHPALQGVMTEECSLEGAWLQPGWTWQAMNAWILEYCRIGSQGAVNSLWHQNMGWSNEPSTDTVEHYRMTDTIVRTYKAGLSPTDLCHEPHGTAYLDTTYGKYITTRYAGETFFFPGVEYHTYIAAGHTAQSVLDHGVDDLGVQFIFWNPTDYSASWVFTADDAIAEVTRQQGRINTTRPSNVPA